MAFDTRHWNLILPLALAATACTTRIPGAVGETGETGTDSESDSGDGTTVGDDGSEGEDGAPECIDDGDCPSYYYCRDGTCVYEEWCDPTGPERCSEYECADDSECDFGLSCADFGDCLLPEQLPPCSELGFTGIPMGDLGSGILHFAQADNDPAADLLLVRGDAILRIDGPDSVVELPRVGDAGMPVAVESMDVDSDGIDELYVTEADGTGALVTIGGDESEVDIEFLAARAGNFLGDGEPELIGQRLEDPLEIGIFTLGQGWPGELAGHQAVTAGTLLPPGAQSDLGFQDVHYVEFQPLASTRLITLAGEEMPDYLPQERVIDFQWPNTIVSGSGPLTGQGAVPVMVGSANGRSRLMAPTLGAQDSLPPSIAFENTFEADDPVVIGHGDGASVVLLGEQMVRIGFDGESFSCQEVLEPGVDVVQIAAGDFDGDGRADLARVDASGNILVRIFSD